MAPEAATTGPSISAGISAAPARVAPGSRVGQPDLGDKQRPDAQKGRRAKTGDGGDSHAAEPRKRAADFSALSPTHGNQDYRSALEIYSTNTMKGRKPCPERASIRLNGQEPSLPPAPQGSQFGYVAACRRAGPVFPMASRSGGHIRETAMKPVTLALATSAALTFLAGRLRPRPRDRPSIRNASPASAGRSTRPRS